MAKNVNTATAEKKTKIDGTRLFLIIFAAIALVGIITALVIGIVSQVRKKPIDYMTANLSKYISLDEQAYKNFEALINLDKVTDMSVEQEIIKLLYSKRQATDGKNKIGQTLKVGDTANIYYYGYTLDDKGNKVAFDGGCNFSSGVTALGIGSGQMITGFELALIGKNSNDYSALTKRTDGVVEEGNFVYITYTAVFFDGAVEKDATALINLNEDVDAVWGEGFKNFLLGKTVGKKIDGTLTVNRINENGIKESDVYSDVTVNTAIDFSEGEPLTIDVTFPRPYQNSAALEGKSVKFDVYIMTSVNYDTPEWNDAFITEKLSVKAEDLADYEGETLTDKYEAKIRAELEATFEKNRDAQVDDALWEHLKKVVKVKKLPEAEVNQFYRGYYADIEGYYATYQSYFSSFDQAARQYLQLASNADWKAELTKQAEQATLEKLIFYYIARNNNLFPSAEEYQRRYDELYNEVLDAYLEQYDIKREDYDSDEKYEEAVDTYRNMVDAQYGDSYFRESVNYEYAMEELRKNVTVKFAE